MTDFSSIFLPYQVIVDMRNGVGHLGSLVSISPSFFHEILNLLLSVIFHDIATADTDTRASSKMQTEKPVARSIGPIDKGRGGFPTVYH